MTKLIPIQVDDTTVIYMEAMPGVEVPPPSTPAPGQELTRDHLNKGDKGAVDDAVRKAAQSFDVLETTVKTYTKSTLNAFRDLALANVDKVTLEFGINMGGEAGVPYVTKGTADCSLKITVECSFPDAASD